MTIRTAQVRNTDLNLLVNFVVLAEERTLSRAARRLFLSQPSMTRALQKLRETFDDALLVRSPSGYVLTPKGENLLQEVAQFLPRLDRLISGREFDPAQESAHFRIAATDNATQLYGPTLSRRSAEWQKTSSFVLPLDRSSPGRIGTRALGTRSERRGRLSSSTLKARDSSLKMSSFAWWRKTILSSTEFR